MIIEEKSSTWHHHMEGWNQGITTWRGGTRASPHGGVEPGHHHMEGWNQDFKRSTLDL